MPPSTRSLLASALIALASIGCGNSGCSTLEPIPGGFPSNERTANAGQMRLTATGLDKLEAHPAEVAQQLLGPSLSINVGSSCGADPSVCCPGGTPSASCGPLEFDPNPKPGDDPRLVLTPVQGSSRIDMTLRTRVKTVTDIPLTVLGAACNLEIDSSPGTFPDIQIDLQLAFSQDAVAGTTRISVPNVNITRLTSNDVSLTGAFACSLANLGIGYFLSVLQDTLADGIRQNLEQAFCRPCASGSVADCGTFATACTSGVCMVGNQCLQELGPSGRLMAGALFGGAPPGSAGALDLYEVAGGYATTNNSGAALGVLGGLLPAGTAHDRCGPSASAPAAVTIPQSAFFQGNTRPDTGQPFDIGLGIHKSQAQRFAWAAYEGGALCSTLDTRTLPTLTSNAFSAVAPSLDNLTRGDRPIWVGFRPQSPPAVVFGLNTFTAGGAVDDPLVQLDFTQAELDVFAEVERQPLRVATIAADLSVPLGAAAVQPGQVDLVLGPLADPPNVSVENSTPLGETTDALKALAPQLQNAVIPELIRRVGPVPLPSVAGLPVAPTSVSLVDNQEFIAMYGNLVPPGTTTLSNAAPFAPGPVETPELLRIVLLALGALGLAIAKRQRLLRTSWGVAGLTLVAAALITPAGCGGDDDASGKKKKTDAGADGASDANDDGSAGDSGSDASTCVPAPCQPGELEPTLGAWSSVARSTRTVITTYDAKYGDAVLVELAGGTQTKKVIDGVPNEPPTHDPSGYRGGVEAEGADVGAWTSVALAGDSARVAYQDRERGALRFAVEGASGSFSAHDVDAPIGGVVAGAYASLALGSTPAIAYLANEIPGANGVFDTELRFARAKVATPTQTSDWTTSVVATAPGSCAGLCGTDVCIAPVASGESERCATPTTDCTTTCAAGEACVTGECRALVPAALADSARGTGLFARLLALADGRYAIVHYDSVQSALLFELETASGSGQFTPTLLDGAGTADRGMWADAVLDTSGNVHVAYTDALTHQVFAVSLVPGSAPSAVESVDDGLRPNDRAHWVGAGLTAWLDGTSLRVAYQDAMTGDVVLATRTGATWSHADLVTGAPLDGFGLAAPANGAGPLVWDQLDATDPASHSLTIHENP